MTDSEDGKKRPNAKYKLSKPDNAVVPKEELVFYYNRDHRLSKAPSHVQDLYKEKKPNRFGFLGILVADTPRKMLFLTIVLMCAVIWIFSFLGFIDSPFNLEGNLVKVSAVIYEDTTIVVVSKRVKEKNAYTGAVDAAVSIPIPLRDDTDVDANADTDVQTENNIYHRLFFTAEKEERYSFAVPFESPELLVVLQTEKKSIKLKVPAKPVD